VTYATVKVEGPPHDRSFTAAAIIDAELVGTGTGRSKKDAEQDAAREALKGVSPVGGDEAPASGTMG
jgi:ribonuclease-3